MDMPQSRLEQALSALGDLLDARGLRYDIVVVGGGNLILRKLVTRPTTKDIDLLGLIGPEGLLQTTELPEPLSQAIIDVARAYGLAPDWINLGPASLLDLGLPRGFIERLEPRAFRSLVVWFASRYDMICFKLYAAVDHGRRSRHFQDLLELEPSADELITAAAWSRTHDPSPAFREALVATLTDLGLKDADGALE